MTEKQAKKSYLEEGKEFFLAFKKQNPLIFWSLAVSVLIFFVPVVNLLLPIYWGVSTYKFFPKIKQRFSSIYARVFISTIIFVVIFLFSNIPVFTYNNTILGINNSKNVEISKEDKSKLDEEKRQKEEAQKLAEEEKQKRENEEKSKKELEEKIAQATKINPEYDVESDLESQSLELAKQANLAIATLGNTTQNQKLFDVISVVDGDTIKVSELGTLRLIGMDTPETKDPRKPVQCFGVEASNRAKELLNGKKVYLEFDPANRIDKYGRTLAYIYREDGYFYNKEMVKDGYANSYTKYPHPKMDEFNQVAKEAREN